VGPPILAQRDLKTCVSKSVCHKIQPEFAGRRLTLTQSARSPFKYTNSITVNCSQRQSDRWFPGARRQRHGTPAQGYTAAATTVLPQPGAHWLSPSLHVVGLTVNIPHLFLNGLKVIVPPTEDAVLRVRSDAKGPRPEPLGQLDREGKDANAYDKMNALGLARMEISRGTLGTLMYFPDYEGMVIWSLVALGNFLIAQGSRCAIPTHSPLGWASVTLCAALLRAWRCNVRLLYLLGAGNDHSKFAVLCGFCGLFAAAAAGAMLPAGFLAFDLREAATALHAWVRGLADEFAAAGGVGAGAGNGDGAAAAAAAAARHGGGIVSEEDFVAAVFLPAVAAAAACVTAAAALPAIRFSQFFTRAFEPGNGASLSYRALLLVDSLLPWLATLVWVTAIPPLVLGERWGGVGEAGMALRVGVTGLAAVARLAVGRFQIQAYLEGVKETVLKDLRQRKVDVQAVRSKFDARFQYLIIAAAQYAAPALTVLLSVALLVHLRAGGGGGAVVAAAGLRLGVCDALRRVAGLQDWDTAFDAAAAAAAAAAATDSGALGLYEGSALAGWSGGSAAVLARKLPEFPAAFWSGVAGFLAWWACLSWGVTYAIGVAFWRCCPEDVSAVERVPSDTTTKGKREKGKGKAKAKGGSKGGGGKG
ncbi:unnamed protein product, partial [Pylaiella littoralis]